ILIERSGGGWSVQDWSHDDKLLLLREYLSINHSRLHLLDIESGEVRLLTPPEAEVSYGRARFSADSRWVDFTTDLDGEFLQRGKIEMGSGEHSTTLPINIPWDIEEFELSPEKGQLAFVANVAGASQLYLMDLTSGKHHRIDAWPVCQIDLGPWRSNGEE